MEIEIMEMGVGIMAMGRMRYMAKGMAIMEIMGIGDGSTPP